MLSAFSCDLFSEQGKKLFFDVCVGGCQAIIPVDISDDGFDTGRVSERAQKFIGSQVSEPDSIHAFPLVQNKLSGIESQHGIANPCRFTFNFQRFVSSHGGIVDSRYGSCEFFHSLTRNSLPQLFFRFVIPVAGLQFKKDRAVG
jgi:hypothetical protein